MKKYFESSIILIIAVILTLPAFDIFAQGVQTQTGDVILRAVVPEVPVIPRPPQPPTTMPLKIYDIQVLDITTSSALIKWKTNYPATSYIKYGKTNILETGEISDSAFKTEHWVRLTNLSVNTWYYFKLKGVSEVGAQAETRIYSFKTLRIPPANVIDFTAIGELYQIRLLWQNPPDANFKGVRIVRSEKFFPLSPYEGTLVYDNSGETHIDKNVKPCVRYYYTAFAYDISGNFASGAVASAVPLPCKFPPAIPWPPHEIKALKIGDFQFRIAQKTINVLPDPLNIFHFLPGIILNISIDTDKMPQVLKTIIIAVGGKSYLLRVDEDEKIYQAGLVLPLQEGLQPIYILVLNFEAGMISKVEGNMLVEPFGKIEEQPETSNSPDQVEAKTEEIKPVYLAKTTLYSYNEDSNNWQVWPAIQYSQKNPIYSNPKGQYGFLVPKGKYYVEVEKEDFAVSKTNEFEIDKNFINQDIVLKQLPKLGPWEKIKWDRVILILILIIFLFGYFLWRHKTKKPVALVPVIPSEKENNSRYSKKYVRTP